MRNLPVVGGVLADVRVPAVDGGSVAFGRGEGWRLIVVYRGLHCPLCTTYLAELERLTPRYAGLGASVVAVSADPKEKAEISARDGGLTFPVGYGLSVEQMQALGLYVSLPRSLGETDRPFAEPALFVVRPDQRLQIACVSNAPWARADLSQIADGLDWIRKNDYPVRGTLA